MMGDQRAAMRADSLAGTMAVLLDPKRVAQTARGRVDYLVG
jgi:hypothetical protein